MPYQTRSYDHTRPPRFGIVHGTVCMDLVPVWRKSISERPRGPHIVSREWTEREGLQRERHTHAVAARDPLLGMSLREDPL